MHRTALLTCLLAACLMNQATALLTLTGMYGQSVKIPCNNGQVTEDTVTFVKWKYEKDGNILVKQTGQNASISSDSNYKTRVSIEKDFSLIIKQVTLADQKTFTCMVVGTNDILEFPVQLIIYKIPSEPKITNQTTSMAIGKLTTLAQCITEGASPAANITWFKNKTPLTADGTGIKINTNVAVDELTGLSTTTSVLQYTAAKGDIDAQFNCQVQHVRSANLDSSPLVFTVNYPTEWVNIKTPSDGPVKEGDNVTIRCLANGNPPPSIFTFYIKGEKKIVENSNSYTLTNVTRANTGEYRCSLVDNDKLGSAMNITVEYVDVVPNTSAKVIKTFGESFEAILDIKASGKTTTSCKKGNDKLAGLPKFDKLEFSDSGVYECEVTRLNIKRTQLFDLTVQGPPVIKSLTKKRADGVNKILSCYVRGFPKPSIQWSANDTGLQAGESKYVNGEVTYYITITPKVNLTVSCTASNELGADTKSIDVSSLVDDVTMDKQDQKERTQDQATLAVGIVVGLVLALLALGLAYWLYLKKFRQGTWKTGEKEDGSAEESKKLEENQSQKAEV